MKATGNVRAKRKLIVAAVVLTPILAVVVWWMAASPGDLSRLAPYTERYAYPAMERQLMAQGNDTTDFCFAVLGDSRNNTMVASRVYDRAEADGPDIIFNTGDLIRGGTVEEYLENHIPLVEDVAPIPVFCIPGNHERGDRYDFAAFKHLYGDDRFSFDYGPCRFVGINASEKIRVDRGELAFLDRELSKPGATYKYVFLHIPPKYFEKEIIGDDRRGFQWNADKLRALLARHKVNEVFMGHIHGYASAVMDGVRYTLTAGGGAPFSERLPAEARVYHYMLIHVTPNGATEELVYYDPTTGEWPRKQIY